jgi:quinol monooxygenase YgiN
MITEVAIIDVLAGQEAAFASAFRDTGYQLLATTPGCISVKMYQSFESTTRFIGVNEWESQEAHLENFRGSARYTRFSEALGPYMAGTPVVEHFGNVMHD